MELLARLGLLGNGSNIPLIALEQVAFVSDGNHLSISEDFVEEGVRYLRGQDLNDFFISETNSAYISHENYKLLTRSHMKTDDVLLSIVGTVGNVAVVTPKYDVLTGSCKIAILRPFAINPLFLAAYLSSKIGQDQLKRRVRGAVQQGLILPDLKRFPIPQLSENTQDAVAELVAESQHQRNRSLKLYTEAETLLLDALGLNDPEAAHAIAYERNFQKVARAGRFDAAYFSPRAQRALEIMGRSGKTLNNVAPLAKRQFKPQSGIEFHYIEIGDLSSDGRAEGSPVAGEEAPSRAQWTVRPRDVMTSTVRPIRRLSALIEPEQDDFVCSSGFAVLQPRDVEPELLLIYLRTPIVCEILDLHTTATMYPAIATDVLLNRPLA